MEAALDKWEEQGKVLKKDFGENFSHTVRVGIVTAMTPESIQEFVYSSLGIAVEYDIILAKIRAFVSNKVAMADGPSPMDVDKVSVDYAKVQTEFSEDDQEIDVVSISSAMDVEAGGTTSLSARPRGPGCRNSIRLGAMGARVRGKEARTRPRELVGSARAAKAAKASFLASVLNLVKWDIASRTG